jgi:hypothetical protein
VDPVPDPTPSEKNPKECPGIEPGTSVFVVCNANNLIVWMSKNGRYEDILSANVDWVKDNNYYC